MGVTIREIAAATGVSITAVSQILNGKGERFSLATRERVLKTAKEQNYKPNFFAKNMVITRTNTIGMIVPEVTDPFFSQMIKGAEDFLNQNDYMIILCNSSNERQREFQYVEELLHRAVDGVIIATPHLIDEKTLSAIRVKKRPYILLDHQLNPRQEGRITIDDVQGGYIATRHLIENGHRKIGIITSDTTFYNVSGRLEGYFEALAEAGIPVQEKYIERANQTTQGGYEAAERLLKEDVTAIFATNDLMAFGTYRAAWGEKIRIPEDLSVIGFDDIEMSAFTTPPLTTVRQPVYQIGATAAELLLRKVEAPTEKVGNQHFEIELIERGSVARVNQPV
ncbi:LacI family DNA-binding transcriptional regulator [Listeria grayi]|uniref:Sugar-binding domain protein n=1 Tax=Listeria grayi DSM 20601 TaxID=525367 RepID=D7UXR5_LISGR|nr:substrate-binding domain-containing protein [Listeria grayi]EFI84473.1 sugar-binding domain protein [Listeria grayi DSM 20601]MBC1922272.1 LacI family transcriptional regulator [Listeria grayi]